MKLVHGSLFSGFDAPSVAASWMGWKNAFHCEINPFCNDILKYWFPNSEHYEDITKTDFSQWRGRIDILTGGFPCQPFSLAGQRKGADDNRYLWPHMLRAIREIRPAWVIGENVAGILTMVQPGKETEVGSQTSLFGEDNRKRILYDKSMSSKPSVKTLNEKDIPSNRCLFRLVPLERPTEETGCGLLHDLLPTPRAVEVVEHPMKAAARTKDRTGTKLNNLSSGAAFGLLPTPMASDATTGVIIGKNDRFVTTRNGTPRKINQNGQNGSVGLARMVRLLPTPNAREADKYSKKYNPNSQMGTALTAMAVNGMLPTPIRRDYQPSVSPQTLKRKDGKMRTDSLCNLPVMLGEHCLQTGGRTSQLNPLFVEEMMGFPLMWTTLPFLSQNGDRNQLKDMETP